LEKEGLYSDMNIDTVYYDGKTIYLSALKEGHNIHF